MERQKITMKDLEDIKIGSIIQYDVWDNDDFTTWIFKAIKAKDCFVYLGGGIDFGAGIGHKMSLAEVLNDINNNDYPKFDLMQLTTPQGNR